MLTAYETQTRSLLQLPGTNSTSLYTTSDLDRFINISRGQLAGETKCIRVIGTLATVVGQQQYNFSSINVGVPATTGVQAPINVRRINYSVGSGQLFVQGYAWEWFNLYYLNNAAPRSGPPARWAQYGQGAAPGATGSGATGSIFISPAPDQAYTLYCDCECYPQILVQDTDVEAIPYLFTDAVPFFAAYYALMSAQTNARMNDAIQYYKMYKEFIERATNASTPAVNGWQFEGAPDPVQLAKLGAKGGGK